MYNPNPGPNDSIGVPTNHVKGQINESNVSRIRCWKKLIEKKQKQIDDNGYLFYASVRWGMVLGQALRPRVRTVRLVPELLHHGSSHQSLPPSLSRPPSHPRRRMRQLRSVPPPITVGSLKIIKLIINVQETSEYFWYYITGSMLLFNYSIQRRNGGWWLCGGGQHWHIIRCDRSYAEETL